MVLFHTCRDASMSTTILRILSFELIVFCLFSRKDRSELDYIMLIYTMIYCMLLFRPSEWCVGVLVFWCDGVLVYWCLGALVNSELVSDWEKGSGDGQDDEFEAGSYCYGVPRLVCAAHGQRQRHSLKSSHLVTVGTFDMVTNRADGKGAQVPVLAHALQSCQCLLLISAAERTYTPEVRWDRV